MNRADRMLAVLRDGRWHAREEFGRADTYYLTNNAASELRCKRGLNVKHKVIDGLHCYRLLTEPGNGERALSESGSDRETAPPFFGSVSSFPATSYERPEAPVEPDGGVQPGQLDLLGEVA